MTENTFSGEFGSLKDFAINIIYFLTVHFTFSSTSEKAWDLYLYTVSNKPTPRPNTFYLSIASVFLKFL